MKALKLISTALLLTSSFLLAQSNTNQKPATPSGQQQTKPEFTIGSGSTPAAQAQAAPAKRQPQAKSQPELQAYAAIAAMKDGAAAEKAADDFIVKYPDSELKGAVYQRTMFAYQQAGNDEKTLEMGRKSLTFNPDDPGVLITMANLIVQKTRETDLDKDERLAEVKKYAQHAIDTVTDYPVPPNMPPEQAAAIKAGIRADAYAAIGAANYTDKKYAEAEASFRQSVDAEKANPNPTTLLRLALTLDKESKYAEGLDVVNRLLATPNLDPRVQTYGQQEKDRLTKLIPAAAPKPAAPAPTTTAPSVPKQ